MLRELVKDWVEQKHPRQPAGSAQGGQFAPAGSRFFGGEEKVVGEFAVAGQLKASENHVFLLEVTHADGTRHKIISKTVFDPLEAENEGIGYRLGKILGLNVPHTEVHGLEVRQEFVAGIMALEVEAERGWNNRDKQIEDPFFQNVGVAILDLVMLQADRHLANIMIAPDERLILPDNGNTLSSDDTHNIDQDLWSSSPFVMATRGWEFEPAEKAMLREITADSSFPKAVRARADFLFRYGKLPFGETAFTELWGKVKTEWKTRD